jgi:hypothetical protein
MIRFFYDYVDPGWMLATLIMFPVLAIVYLLLSRAGFGAPTRTH